MMRPPQAQKQPSRTDIEKHCRRWLAVFEAHREGLTWKDAYKAASKRLKDTPAAGEARAMKWSYAKIQRSRRNAVEEW
jgi:hypothetical protein